MLLNEAVGLASEILEEHGEFSPFALALRHDGEIVHVAPDEDTEETESEAVVRALEAAIRVDRAEYRAIAVVADVTLEDENDEPMSSAVSIAIEHRDETPLNCYVPYEFEDEKLKLGDLMPEEGVSRVFSKDPPN